MALAPYLGKQVRIIKEELDDYAQNTATLARARTQTSWLLHGG